MKNIYFLLLIFLSFIGTASAQLNEEERIIVEAMKDQLQYSMDSLRLKDFPRPHYIQYIYKRGEGNYLNYSKGALYDENLSIPVNLIRADIIIKDDKGNSNLNLNYKGFPVFSKKGEGMDDVSINVDYDEIRRVFWWLSDVQYKAAINDYEAKKRRISEPSLPDEIKKTLTLSDFEHLPKTIYHEPMTDMQFDVKYWKELLSEVSGLWNDYQQLYDVSAILMNNYNHFYSIDSDGSEMRHSSSDMTINVRIMLEDENKKRFFETLVFSGFSAKDIPNKQAIMAETKEAIELVLQLSKAGKLDKEYLGPVLLDAPVVVNNQLVNNLSAGRLPVMSNGNFNTTNDNVGVRLFSSNISIKSVPALSEFKGQKLFGKYDVDADGVKPQKESLLVGKGILKQLMGDRIPTFGTEGSTGHNRYVHVLQNVGKFIMPGVIQVVSTQEEPVDALKTSLINLAKENGEKYAFIVRRLKNGNTDWLYKVDVESGAETLMNGGRVNLNANKPLRRIVATSDNTTPFLLKIFETNNTVISPDKFLLEEVSIMKQ